MNRLPLALSLARLAAAPMIAILILWGDDAFFAASAPVTPWVYCAALVLFLAAAAADLLDTMLARKLNAAGDLSGALGRAAGLALTACTLLALAKTSLPFDLTIAAVLIVAREAMIAGLREGLALSARPLPAGQGGKLQPAAVWLGCGCALAAQTMIYFSLPVELIGWLLTIARGTLWAGAALAVITGALYARDAFAKPAA
ncbi:MAG TPA: CDP-alcohol phosphatidyltransferase family protein [Caulobacterales bacterium]|jgi:phosphatidylglycerophosphate synthase|nr:CDP-alcohol phosphatidyltransferase family protein [Caulobacterales bacterium]